MKRFLTLLGTIALTALAPHLALAQWTDGQEGLLVIRGGWLFDGIADERRPNTGITMPVSVAAVARARCETP